MQAIDVITKAVANALLNKNLKFFEGAGIAYKNIKHDSQGIAKLHPK